MKLLVTGATGFLGRHVVAAAVERGHEVRALVRAGTRSLPDGWDGHSAIEVARGDLRNRANLPAVVGGIDCVIHLAASKAGDLYEQLGGTVIATENLLDAMVNLGVNNIVLTSSFAVYEYLHQMAWTRLDEGSALADEPGNRDEYCQTKLFQEQLVREYARANDWRLVVLRPGVVFGRENLWTARLGATIGDRWCIRIGSFAPLPLTYVENCADAVVRGAEYSGNEQELIVNIVDDHLPSQRTYLRSVRHHIGAGLRIVPLPWWIHRAIARLAWVTSEVAFKGRAKVPGVLVPSKIHARCKPRRYDNTRAKSQLGWNPRFTWREGVMRAIDTSTAPDTVPHSVRVTQPKSTMVATT